MFKRSKFFPAQCGKQTHFLTDLLDFLWTLIFTNLLLKSSRAGKVFDMAILQAASERTANSGWSDVADLQTFGEGEIRSNAGL